MATICESGLSLREGFLDSTNRSEVGVTKALIVDFSLDAIFALQVNPLWPGGAYLFSDLGHQ